MRSQKSSGDMTKIRRVATMAAADCSVRRVIVADDDDLVRMVVRAVLEAEGFIVDEAPTGADAVAANARERADLVIIDAHMPGLPLSTSLADLVAARDNSGAPGIVVISGDLYRPTDASDSTVGFLAKPVDLRTLLDTVALFAVHPAGNGNDAT
jgi:two-component system, response regulator, stage 0 sporulation protein F